MNIEKKVEVALRILSKAEDLQLSSVIDYEEKKLSFFENQIIPLQVDCPEQIKLNLGGDSWNNMINTNRSAKL